MLKLCPDIKLQKVGGDVLQICVFMTDIHIVGLKIGLKNINLRLYDQYFYVFVFLGMLHYLLLYYGAGNN